MSGKKILKITKFIKMKQTDTAINMLRSANAQFKNMIRVGRQVGGRSC